MNETADEGDPSLASFENVGAALSIRIEMKLTNKIPQKKSKSVKKRSLRQGPSHT
jgi:hypothetical protein